jgi:N-methylhydantoinase A
MGPTVAVVDGPRTLSVFDPIEGARLDYAVFDRATLEPGAALSGPCLITEAQTTTVAPKGFIIKVAPDGALILTRPVDPSKETRL